MTPEEIERKIASHDRSIDALLELAADNENKITRLAETVSTLTTELRADIKSLAASVLDMGTTVRTLISLQGQTQNSLQGLIETVDRFIKGHPANGGRNQ